MEEHRNKGSPRLQFTKEELENPALAKPIAKVEKAENKLERAKRKLPKRHRIVLKSEIASTAQKEAAVEEKTTATGDARSGATAKPKDAVKKKTVRLKFEETQAKQPSKLTHPVQKAVYTANDQLHRQVADANEDDNAAVSAMLKADDVKGSALRAGEHAYHANKLRPYRQAGKAERKLDEANIRFMEAKQRSENPHSGSNPFSRWQQKRAIRKEYAAAKSGRNTGKSAKSAEEAVRSAKSAGEKIKEFASHHPTALVVIAFAAMLLIVMSSLQACTPLAQSVLESIVIGTYPATEKDVKAAESAYAAKERELKDMLDHYQQNHPEYDEVNIDADDIWHDPYVLIAIISAYYDGEDWTADTAAPVIEKYFNLQYIVTETVTTEIHYRTVKEKQYNEETGKWETIKVKEPYTYKICNVTLENKNLSHLPVVSMSHHTMGMYALYMATHGNMEGIFSGYAYATLLKDPTLYDIPEETLAANPTFAKLMEEAEKYIGYPYVWGGASPETSFDCSGFVSYVFTNSGVYNTGRLGAKGLRNLCKNVSAVDVQPGDIVFFEGTMGDDVDGVTHCGIYVGNGMMIHCGSPIGYANLNDSYWKQHFHSFGRVPGM